MFEKLELSRMAHAMASHAMVRQDAISQNVAHADTPGYKAKDVAPFAQTYAAEDGFAVRTTRLGHLLASAGGYVAQASLNESPDSQSPNGNTVSLETEMMKAAAVRQQYDLALAIAKSSSGIVRTSLGRGR